MNKFFEGVGYAREKHLSERPEEMFFKDETVWEEGEVPSELMEIIRKNSAVREAILLIREKCKIADVRHVIKTAKLMLSVLSAEDMRKRIDLSDKKLLLEAALGHDVGKAYVPQEILHKEGKPTADEKVMIDEHIRKGEEFFMQRGSDELAEIIVRHHQIKQKPRSGEDRRKEDVSIDEEKRNLQNKERRTEKPEYDRLARFLSIVDIFESMGNLEREYAKEKSARKLLEERKKELVEFDSSEERVMIDLLEIMDENELLKRAIVEQKLEEAQQEKHGQFLESTPS